MASCKATRATLSPITASNQHRASPGAIFIGQTRISPPPPFPPPMQNFALVRTARTSFTFRLDPQPASYQFTRGADYIEDRWQVVTNGATLDLQWRIYDLSVIRKQVGPLAVLEDHRIEFAIGYSHLLDMRLDGTVQKNVQPPDRAGPSGPRYLPSISPSSRSVPSSSRIKSL
jgi:hypothetical protein